MLCGRGLEWYWGLFGGYDLPIIFMLVVVDVGSINVLVVVLDFALKGIGVVLGII